MRSATNQEVTYDNWLGTARYRGHLGCAMLARSTDSNRGKWVDKNRRNDHIKGFICEYRADLQ